MGRNRAGGWLISGKDVLIVGRLGRCGGGEAPADLAEDSAAALEKAARFLFSDTGMDASIRDENGRRFRHTSIMR